MRGSWKLLVLWFLFLTVGAEGDIVQMPQVEVRTACTLPTEYPWLDKAIVTLVASPAYAVGAAVLVCWLARLNVSYPIVVLVTEDVPEHAMKIVHAFKDNIHSIRRIRNPALFFEGLLSFPLCGPFLCSTTDMHQVTCWWKGGPAKHGNKSL